MADSFVFPDFEVEEGGGVPAGQYRASFVGVRERDPNEFGTSVAFIWKVDDGELAGQEATRICGIDRPPTPRNALGKVLSGLQGSPVLAKQRVSPQQFVGRPYLITVADASGGNGTRVEFVTPDLSRMQGMDVAKA